MVCDFKSLCVRCAGNKDRLGESRVPVSFQARETRKAVDWALCCKILRAIAPAAAKSWMRDHANFSSANLSLEEPAYARYSRIALAPRSLDTGPPGAHSFAELILQRSLLAHAPPSLA